MSYQSSKRETDVNHLLENKKTEECWDIVKKELEFMINKFVPVKRQKTYAKETFIEGCTK